MNRLAPIVCAALGYGLSLTAAPSTQAEELLNWQAICQPYYAEICGSSLDAAAIVAAYAAPSFRLPQTSVETAFRDVPCFMSNLDGSALDLTLLCSNSLRAPLLAQMSVTGSLAEVPVGDERASSTFKSERQTRILIK